jgi:membrane protein YqaA with SNARE-associated domain
MFAIALIEASIFPIPPDVLLIAIVAARPASWLRAALVCTIGSILGAIGGYVIGNGFMVAIGQPIVDAYGLQPEWEQVVTLYNGDWGLWFLAGAALTPIPFKVATIAAGATGIGFWPFLMVVAIGRSLRFALVAGLLKIFGAPIRRTLERHFDLAALSFLLLLVGGFILLTLF